MDKDKLFFLVRPGTNERKVNPSGEPLIVESQLVNVALRSLPGMKAVTITEFERQFSPDYSE